MRVRVRVSSFVSHITCRPFLPLLFHSKDAITSYSIYYEYSKVCVQVLLYCSTKVDRSSLYYKMKRCLLLVGGIPIVINHY